MLESIYSSNLEQKAIYVSSSSLSYTEGLTLVNLDVEIFSTFDGSEEIVRCPRLDRSRYDYRNRNWEF